MTKQEKLISRFLACPKDFSWDELTAVLKRLGFSKLQGRGSRVKFFHAESKCLIQLHKPHPGNIVKPYMIKDVIYILEERELI